MNSRMNKYYEEELTNSRYHRNEELYKKINTNELSNFDIKSNATVLGDNNNSIDVEKIKKILDTKYNEIPKRKSIRLEEEPEKEIEKEITKEYDINIILEKAREGKKEDYEEERLRKLRDTQYDILNSLNIKKEEKEEVEDDDDLKALINTIAYNESHNNTNVNSALDVLSDLKGENDTEVLKGLKEEVKEDIENEKDITSTKMINSFYTSSNALNEKDFEDLDDFTKSVESNGIFIKIIIAIVILAFIVGLILLVKTICF